MRVHSDAELADLLAAASWWNTSRRKRLRIDLAAGTYRQQIHLIDGIDLSGDGEILWDKAGDTIVTHGADTVLTDVTVTNSGPNGYAIHADAPCPNSALRLVGVDARSDASPALGAGLFGGQRVEALDSTFTSGGFAAIHLHPWLDQSRPSRAQFTSCYAASPNAGLFWNQLDSGQLDELHWTGVIDAPTALEATKPPPVLALACPTHPPRPPQG